jgi:beta-galactosidase
MLRHKFRMKSAPTLAVLVFAAALLPTVCPAAEPARVTENLDANWLFLKANTTNAQQIQFDDSTWRKLNVPHDWSIEEPFSPTNKTGGAGGFLPSGVGWYRRHFTLPENFSNRCVFIEFDGVMANSDVWINGSHLGHRPYGYVSFGYELTGHLNSDGDNVLAVRVDDSRQPASRWYAGAGIYRHVWLVATDPVHIAHWGVSVSTPQISEKQATVRVQTAVTNESDTPREITLRTTLTAPNGRVAATIETTTNILAAGAPISELARAESSQHAGLQTGAPFRELRQELVVRRPRLWNLDNPQLYRAVSTLVAGGKTLDVVTNTFGIRDAHFEAATGFWLNGKNFKIKGVCLHAGGGAFGAAVPLSVWEARLKTLKSLGVNAIRTAHNPPAPEFLDLCDRMGLLVMDEFFDCWTVGKTPYDYHLYFDGWSHRDEHDTILRDRNHPSIILYSVGNEIHDTPHAELAKKILAGLIAVAHETDPTRPVTMALFRPNKSHDYDDGLADMLDVIGQNYRENEILAAHEQKPSRKILGTENQHSRDAWLALRDNPPYAGQFLWSGIDYLGESRRWPVIGAGSGLLDRTGAPKPMAFQRQSWWSDKPMVFVARRIARNARRPTDPGYEPASQNVLRRPQVLFADWTPRNLQPHDEDVEVCSNCKEVELFLNGKSLGKKMLNADASPRNWRVPFAPGVIRAVARNGRGSVVAKDEMRTAGQPAKIVLSANRRKIADDWDDVSEVTAEITDKDGVRIPNADNLVSFKISGPGRIAAVDNGDNASHESFQASERHAFQGRCVAFVKAIAPAGKIIVTTSAPGLAGSSVAIKVAK